MLKKETITSTISFNYGGKEINLPFERCRHIVTENTL